MDLKKLSAIAEKLNSASDEANQKLLKLQEALAKTNINIEAWTDESLIDSDFTEENDLLKKNVVYLGWTRIDSKWQLAIKRTVVYGRMFHDAFEITDERKLTTIPVINASRTERIKAVAALPLLENAIEMAADKLLVSLKD